MSLPQIHAILPLALLEAMRNLDTPIDDGLAELAHEMVSKRLGLSTTVASQIERYRETAERGGSVSLEEAVSVFRLVSRRADAELVFADAGRRAARYTARTARGPMRGILRASPQMLRRPLGVRVAARVARRVFLAQITPADPLASVELPDSLAHRAEADGVGCYFYGAAFAELFRVLIGFEGAMHHEQCRARGDLRCTWRASFVEDFA